MSSALYDVTAIGNALVDVISNTSDLFLQQQGITKGAMTLIDADQAKKLYASIGPALEISGGSAANTVAGIASLGGKTAFMGKVAKDQLGDIFHHDLKAQGVHFINQADAHSKVPTGQCIVLVTPDAQRSMNTCLGIAVDFGPSDVQPALIRDSMVTYLEGYLFDPPEAQKAFRLAASVVRETHRKLSLSLSDVFCVNRHRTAFRTLIQDEVDILFANQGELMALYEVAHLKEALDIVRNECAIAVTTCGEKGAIVTAGDVTLEISAVPVSKVVDTTGAGDLFAAGFLYGFTQGKPLAEAGRIAAVAAAEIIGHYGPRPQTKLSRLI